MINTCGQEPPYTASRSNRAVTASLQHCCRALYPGAANSSLPHKLNQSGLASSLHSENNSNFRKGTRVSCQSVYTQSCFAEERRKELPQSPPARPLCPHLPRSTGAARPRCKEMGGIFQRNAGQRQSEEEGSVRSEKSCSG